MSALGRVARRLLERSDPISLEDFGALLARGSTATTTSGVAVGEKAALGLTAWYSGVRYLSETVGFLPLHTYTETVVGDKRIKRRSADPLWMPKPSPLMTRSVWLERCVVAIIHRGNAYAWKIRDHIGRVVGLNWIDPDDVVAVGEDVDDGRKLFQVKTRTGVRVFTEFDVWHQPGFGTHPLVGMSAMDLHRESLGTAIAAEQYAARYYSQGIHLGSWIQLTKPMKKTDAGELEKDFSDFHRGLMNAHSLAVLSEGAEYKTVDLKAEDAQLLQSRQYGVTEVARILRIPPHKLYDLTRATFSNIEHQSIESVVDSIRPWCLRFEDGINTTDLVGTNRKVEFVLEGLLRGDTASRMTAYASAINVGIYSPNEVRELENRPPYDGGDEFTRPLNMGTVTKDVGDKPAGATEGK